jgi:hypothetical protein
MGKKTESPGERRFFSEDPIWAPGVGVVVVVGGGVWTPTRIRLFLLILRPIWSSVSSLSVASLPKIRRVECAGRSPVASRPVVA